MNKLEYSDRYMQHREAGQEGVYTYEISSHSNKSPIFKPLLPFR